VLLLVLRCGNTSATTINKRTEQQSNTKSENHIKMAFAPSWGRKFGAQGFLLLFAGGCWPPLPAAQTVVPHILHISFSLLHEFIWQ